MAAWLYAQDWPRFPCESLTSLLLSHTQKERERASLPSLSQACSCLRRSRGPAAASAGRAGTEAPVTVLEGHTDWVSCLLVRHVLCHVLCHVPCHVLCHSAYT